MRRPTRNSWRETAAAVVEELFPSVEVADWDALLDLRGKLLLETDGKELIDEFLRCKQDLEQDHYLPFYRLRRILAAHLRLEGMPGLELRELLRRERLPRTFFRLESRLVETA